MFGRQLAVRLETASASSILWAHTATSRIVAARFESDSVLYLEEGGRFVRLSSEAGVLLDEWRMECGQLSDVCLGETSLLFATAAREVGSYDLTARKLLARTPALDQPVLRVFPWAGGKAIVVTGSLFGVVELGKKPDKSLQDFPPKGYKPAARISYGAHDSKHKVIVLGSEDGALAITDAATGRLLYAIRGISGAITGFSLVPDLSVAIVTTARGQLYYWDLLADKVLEGLLAHRGGILGLRVDSRGRYLVTSGKDGQVRMWETSWTASLSMAERPSLDWLPQDTAFSKIARFFRRG